MHRGIEANRKTEEDNDARDPRTNNTTTTRETKRRIANMEQVSLTINDECVLHRCQSIYYSPAFNRGCTARRAHATTVSMLVQTTRPVLHSMM